jgi:DNA modification methylase
MLQPTLPFGGEIEKTPAMDTAEKLNYLVSLGQWNERSLANALGTSMFTLHQCRAGSGSLSPEALQHIDALVEGLTPPEPSPFASTGVRSEQRARRSNEVVPLTAVPSEHGILPAISSGTLLLTADGCTVEGLLQAHAQEAATASNPPDRGMSAGKNTYTYDAHTYHTKVPPQGIAELVRHYLPDGGLMMDPFAGSGMTGVAGLVTGCDVVLNELSPAASFISSRFVSAIRGDELSAAIASVVGDLQKLREQLYTTECRECGADTELLYTVWAFDVVCPECSCEFNIWDACRSYGRTVREHKILSEFPCPHCHATLKKSRLKRTEARPVEVGYKCCGSKQREVTHVPDERDMERVQQLWETPPLAEGFYPSTEIPDGVNLGQPRRHGLATLDSWYTPRNLAALSHIWRNVHRIEDPQLRATTAFVFTSLYQRVTRFSEFRFWGGSGNTARFNVPFIYNESNVFISLLRKAQTIRDHLDTTATHYKARCAVVNGSATNLDLLPDESVDLIFTDPPFGANINYSEVNIIWESWLDRFTNATNEAIVNRVQGKSVEDYGRLMKQSMAECYRVLRPGHWMLLVFMNSSAKVWSSLRSSIEDVGFEIVGANVFDKQHATFKHYVSPNTSGADLVLHCLKPSSPESPKSASTIGLVSDGELTDFMASRNLEEYHTPFLHVARETEVDFRRLYSEWTAQQVMAGRETIDFEMFRQLSKRWLDSKAE